MDKKEVYLDNAATTKPYTEVMDAVYNCLRDSWGNPSSLYQIGFDAKELIQDAREKIARTLGCLPEEIYFTSGGSESDNWALKMIAHEYQVYGRHIITSTIEHKAILKSCRWLQKQGFDISYVEPDERGYINPKDIQELLRDDTILVSIMTANNEIGTIQPIKEIGDICKEHGVLFHTDAVQAYGHIRMNVNNLGVQLLSASGHKFGGPKGVGFLYVKNGVDLIPYIHGGGQERMVRAGTENVPGIVGMGIAADRSDMMITLHDNDLYIEGLRDHFIERIIHEISGVKLNGSLINRLPNNVNFTFEGVGAQSAVQLLSDMGVYCSAGSACNNGDPSPSHVLTAIGLTKDEAQSSLRFSLGVDTTKEDVDYAIDMIKLVVDMLRA